jgi:hypothetical protein
MLRYYYRKAARPALFLDAGHYAASTHAVCIGDHSHPRHQAENRASSLADEWTWISTLSTLTEILTVSRFQSTKCGVVAGRPSIFTSRDEVTKRLQCGSLIVLSLALFPISNPGRMREYADTRAGHFKWISSSTISSLFWMQNTGPCRTGTTPPS